VRRPTALPSELHSSIQSVVRRCSGDPARPADSAARTLTACRSPHRKPAPHSTPSPSSRRHLSAAAGGDRYPAPPKSVQYVLDRKGLPSATLRACRHRILNRLQISLHRATGAPLPSGPPFPTGTSATSSQDMREAPLHELQGGVRPCLTGPVPPPRSVVPSLDKGTPGESRGRKATDPRFPRDSESHCREGPYDRRAAELGSA
jgi:hypothetical protein